MFFLDKYPPICFFFPYFEVSGVPVLFTRLAKAIVECGYPGEVSVIDYEDGAMARCISENPKIRLIPFRNGTQVSPPRDAVLVMQSILPYSIRPELIIPDETKILFWTLHPDNLIPVLLPFPYIRNLQNKSFLLYSFLVSLYGRKIIKRIQEFVRICIEHNAMLFMDGPNLRKTESFLFIKISAPVFLQVPGGIFLEEKVKIYVGETKNRLSFTWLGRLCEFKSHILIYSIKKLSALATSLHVKIDFNVVGNGPFYKHIKKLKVNNPFFSLHMHGNIAPHLLDDFLLKNTDFLMAMGTSALEGARLGIPTILLDISYFPVKKDYKFRWLFDTQNYDLGHDLSSNDYLTGNTTLQEILQDGLHEYNNLSKESIKYFCLNHDLKLVVEKFLAKVAATTLHYKDIPPDILRKNIARKIFEKIKGYR